MPLAQRITDAITAGSLATSIANAKNGFSIEILIDGVTVGSVDSLYKDRPTARVTDEGLAVAVKASPGLVGGFKIRCTTVEMSNLIARELEHRLAATHADLCGRSPVAQRPLWLFPPFCD